MVFVMDITIVPIIQVNFQLIFDSLTNFLLDHIKDEDYTIDGPCKTKHIECNSEEFKCSFTHKCIPIEYVCDEVRIIFKNQDCICFSNMKIKGFGLRRKRLF